MDENFRDLYEWMLKARDSKSYDFLSNKDVWKKKNIYHFRGLFFWVASFFQALN